MSNKRYYNLFFLLFIEMTVLPQNSLILEDALRLAKLNTIEYREQENNFLKEYLSFKHYRTSLLPRVSFTANPFSINRAITERYDYENNIETFRQSSTVSSNSGLNISQVIPWTGGNLKVGGFLSRIENFGDSKITSYNSTPFRINYSQSLLVHNPYCWDKIEVPLKFRLAKLHFLQYEQELNKKVVQLYFDLIKASQIYELAQTELYNSDTLLIAGKRLLQINTSLLMSLLN